MLPIVAPACVAEIHTTALVGRLVGFASVNAAPFAIVKWQVVQT